LYVNKEFQRRIEPLVISWGYESENPSHSQFLDYIQWQGTYDISAYLTIPDTINFLKNHNWNIVTKECHNLNLWAQEKLISEMDFDTLCTHTFSGQMSSFYFDFKNPLNEKNLIDFYNRYKIQVPFMSWNNKVLFRISLQAYNDKHDIYKLIEAMKDYQNHL